MAPALSAQGEKRLQQEGGAVFWCTFFWQASAAPKSKLKKKEQILSINKGKQIKQQHLEHTFIFHSLNIL